VSFIIAYVDAADNRSIRRIRMRQVLREPGGITYLRAFCYERNSVRTFRTDRIAEIIDLDGVIHDPVAFFRDEMQFSFDPSRPPGSGEGNRNEQAGAVHRRIARDGIRVLVALSRSDGFLHPLELAAMMDYVRDRATMNGFETTEADSKALTAYLRRQRPDPDIVDACLEALGNAPVAERDLFLTYARKVILADGREHPAELAIMDEILNRI
jgi:tellurite resistance protein